jgi:hypothetical protein
MTDIEFSPPVESARINWSYLWGSLRRSRVVNQDSRILVMARFVTGL